MSIEASYKCRIENDKLVFHGVDFGPKGVKIIVNKSPYFLIKWGGYTGWSGVGQTDYIETMYEVWMLEESGEKGYYHGKKLIGRAGGRKWRSVIEEYTKYINELVKNE